MDRDRHHDIGSTAAILIVVGIAEGEAAPGAVAAALRRQLTEVGIDLSPAAAARLDGFGDIFQRALSLRAERAPGQPVSPSPH
ncbi:MAG: hypothetical protein WCY29_15810 [Novosphingobium sp.]